VSRRARGWLHLFGRRLTETDQKRNLEKDENSSCVNVTMGYIEPVNELKNNIETLAAKENKTPLEIITQLQAGAALTENNELLDMLCEVKWDYIAV
jgi:hypothetical protein